MIPAFSISPRIAAKYQDQIAAHMLASLPSARRRDRSVAAGKAALKRSQEAFMAKRQAERDTLAPKVRQLFAQGLNQTQIASQLGISRNLAQRVFREAGLKVVASNAQKSKAAADLRSRLAPDVLRMLAEGMTRRDIAAQLGMDRNTVARIINDDRVRRSERVAA